MIGPSRPVEDCFTRYGQHSTKPQKAASISGCLSGFLIARPHLDDLFTLRCLRAAGQFYVMFAIGDTVKADDRLKDYLKRICGLSSVDGGVIEEDFTYEGSGIGVKFAYRHFYMTQDGRVHQNTFCIGSVAHVETVAA